MFVLGAISESVKFISRERKCADTTDTVLVPWAGHFQFWSINIFSNKILACNFIRQRKLLWFEITQILNAVAPVTSKIHAHPEFAKQRQWNGDSLAWHLLAGATCEFACLCFCLPVSVAHRQWITIQQWFTDWRSSHAVQLWMNRPVTRTWMHYIATKNAATIVNTICGHQRK